MYKLVFLGAVLFAGEHFISDYYESKALKEQTQLVVQEEVHVIADTFETKINEIQSERIIDENVTFDDTVGHHSIKF